MKLLSTISTIIIFKLSMSVLVSVRLSVRHKPVLYKNG